MSLFEFHIFLNFQDRYRSFVNVLMASNQSRRQRLSGFPYSGYISGPRVTPPPKQSTADEATEDSPVLKL